jgi:hypothetical protein
MKQDRLIESYHNKFLDLQIKYRKDKDKYVLLLLLYIFFLEFLTHPTHNLVYLYAPFIKEIKNINKTQVVIGDIENAINGKGKLVNELKEVKILSEKEINYLTSIIPNKSPNIKQNQQNDKQQYYDKLRDDADIIEQNHLIVEHMNKTILGKEIKQWNTQRDNRVRKTTFHQNIDRKRVNINELFNIGDDYAKFPADSLLPPRERLNCRCYLTYY